MMPALATIFLEFNLPNATTWFYFSLLLAVALFFKFSRLLSIRNWDLLSLFLLVPGLLLLEEARQLTAAGQENHANTLRWIGYVWLLAGSAYYLIRCLVDLALVRRPSLSPNLTPGGLAWLSAALFVCLVSVAARPTTDPTSVVGKKTVGLEEVEKRLEPAAENVVDGNTPFWVNFGLAIACHLAIVVGLLVIGRWHFQDLHAGMAAATLYLLVPYTALYVGQVHHVWPMAVLLWAVVFYRRPSVAGLFLGLAAGLAYFPALLFPLWFSFYWRRGAGRFALFFLLTAGVSLAGLGISLWLQKDLSATLNSAMALADWQAWKEPTTEGIWKGIHWAYRLPIFIAYLSFVVITSLWPWPKNLAHLLSLSAALLIGIQFWYADKGGVYVLWYLPLLVLMVFRPNLAERRPLPIAAENDWLAATRRWLAGHLVRVLRGPEPLVRAR
jgi:hypothetical protein